LSVKIISKSEYKDKLYESRLLMCLTADFSSEVVDYSTSRTKTGALYQVKIQ
jgi:hypothetical protein